MTNKENKSPDLALPPDIDNDKVKLIRRKVTRSYSEEHFYINGTIYSSEPWFYPLLKTLTTSVKDETIVIHMSTPGGSLWEATSLVSAIKRAINNGVKVKLYVSGACMSAGTIILFGAYSSECTVNIDHNTQFLFHNAKLFDWGKVPDIKSHIDFQSDYIKKLYNKYFKNILTQEEIDDILINGKELYMDGEEVYNRVVKFNDKLKEEAERRQEEENEEKRLFEEWKVSRQSTGRKRRRRRNNRS